MGGKNYLLVRTERGDLSETSLIPTWLSWLDIACKTETSKTIISSCSIDFNQIIWVQKSIGAPTKVKLNIPQFKLAKLGQSGGNRRSGSQEVLDSILIRGNSFWVIYFGLPYTGPFIANVAHFV